MKAFLVATVLSLTFNALTRPPATMRAPSGANIRVGGHILHYERWGAHGSPILLVHGFAESTVSWAETARDLSRDHVVVAMDLPGYGYSEHDGHYALRDEADAVLGLVAALHLQRLILIGHSLGAAVVGEVARRAPAQISGMIFADGDAMPVQGGGSGRRVMSWFLRTPYAITLYRAATRWSWLDGRIIKQECGTSCRGYSDALAHAWMRPLQQGAAENALAVMARQGMLAMTPQAVQSIRTPRGIIWGAEDSVGGGSLTGAQNNLHHPKTVVLRGAGHLSMVSDPDGFARAVRTITASWGHT